MGFLIFMLVLAAASAVGWFIYPAIRDVVLLERENTRISALTKQTKRDMDNLARRQRNDSQRRDGW